MKYRVLQRGYKYFPQRKVLFLWVNLNNGIWSLHLETAIKYIKNYEQEIKEKKQDKEQNKIIKIHGIEV